MPDNHSSLRMTPASGERPRILVVDDAPEILNILLHALQDEYIVIAARTGVKALQLAAAIPAPDLILLDIVMPEMDGYQVCARLKEEKATRSIPVIFLTSLEEEESEIIGLGLGAVDYIRKPINPPVVRARVHNHVMLKVQANELRRLAATDALTGLANRRIFDEALDLEWRRARRMRQPLALAMVDIDFFKQFNDLYGHPAGDACIQAIAGVLHDSARRPGDIAARYGGEEFALILPCTDRHAGMLLGDKLCEAVRALEIPHANSSIGAFVTVSVGIASAIPDKGADAAELVAAADHLLYAAKGAGRNRALVQNG